MNYTLAATSHRRSSKSPARSRRSRSPGRIGAQYNERTSLSSGTYDYGSENEPTPLPESTTLKYMSRFDYDNAWSDFKIFFKQKHKYSDSRRLWDAARGNDDSLIDEEFKAFYANNDLDMVSSPLTYQQRMADYELHLKRGKANASMCPCIVSGGKSRKHRKHRKSRKYRKSKKY